MRNALGRLLSGCGLAGSRPDATGTDEGSGLLVIGDLVAWHDRAGEVIRASPSAARVVGARPGDLVGAGLLRRVHVSDRPIFLRALSDALNGEGVVAAEFRLHVGDESRVIWVEMRAERVGGASRAARGAIVSVIRDTTARRAHAEELVQARLEAERANELKGRFLATVTHELRTPLNAIIGFSELLAMNHPFVLTDERRMEYAAIIRSSGHHLLDVVNTLLDMSKIETGNFAFEPESFSLGELVDGCCDLVQLKADEAGIDLRREVSADLPEVTADRRACRQILINLVSNAVKFTPAQGSVTVAIRREGERVVLSVADTGIGIGEADLPRLGDPFFQAGDAYRRPHEGTGLGLSVVRGLVGLHHGALMVESGAGLGTTVTVTLPLDCSRVPQEPAGVPVGTRVRRRPPALVRKNA